MDLREGYRRAPATFFLCASLVAVFVAERAFPQLGALALSHESLARGMWWTLATHTFLHANLLHLAVNVLALWFIGPAVESTLGRTKFLLLYFLSGIAGGILQTVFTPASADQQLVGASGAVCGLLLSFTTAYPDVTLRALIFFVIPVTAKARTIGIGLIVFSLACALLHIAPSIGHLSHLGGALTGALLTWLWRPAIPRRAAPASHDALVAKVIEVGIDGLTPEERKHFEGMAKRPVRSTPRR